MMGSKGRGSIDRGRSMVRVEIEMQGRNVVTVTREWWW